MECCDWLALVGGPKRGQSPHSNVPCSIWQLVLRQ